MKERVPKPAGVSAFRASSLRYCVLRNYHYPQELMVQGRKSYPPLSPKNCSLSSSVPCCRLLATPTRVLWPQRMRRSLLGSQGRKGEGDMREHSWRRVSHKNTAAASLALLGLMRGVVTATLNSG